MNHEAIVDRTRRSSGVDSIPDTERAIEAVVETLGERLPLPAAEALAAELPATMREWPLRRRVPGTFARDELYDRVQRRCARTRGFAIELTQSVCGVLREELSESTARQLDAALPEEIAELLHPREPDPAPPSQHRGAIGQTLATGRPGSRHPLSEAGPERAHQHSVVRTTEPHADTKLSSSRGLTQERLDESLATGKPGPRHTINSR